MTRTSEEACWLRSAVRQPNPSQLNASYRLDFWLEPLFAAQLGKHQGRPATETLCDKTRVAVTRSKFAHSAEAYHRKIEGDVDATSRIFTHLHAAKMIGYQPPRPAAKRTQSKEACRTGRRAIQRGPDASLEIQSDERRSSCTQGWARQGGFLRTSFQPIPVFLNTNPTLNPPRAPAAHSPIYPQFIDKSSRVGRSRHFDVRSLRWTVP